MNKGLLALNGILGVAVIILFYLHFSDKSDNKVATVTATETAEVTRVEVSDSLGQFLNLDSNITAKPIKIAYVDSDSLDKNLKMLKDVEKEIVKKEKQLQSRIKSEKRRYEANFEAKLKAFEKKRNDFSVQAPTMTDAQGKAAQEQLMQMQQELAGYEQKVQIEMMNTQTKLEEEYIILKSTKMADYYAKVQGYCESIAKRTGFDYILLYQKGGAILHANNTYNLSQYVIEAINNEYDSKQTVAE